MQNTTITHNNNNWPEKIREDIATITRIIHQYNVTPVYLSNPENIIEIEYMSAFAKRIHIPSLLENPNITDALKSIILALHSREESNDTKQVMKRIEIILHESRIGTTKIL